MEAKEIKITPPEGYEIDKENSTFECIKFKSKGALSYENVAKKLFIGKIRYFISLAGKIEDVNSMYNIYDDNNATSKKQLEKLLAINKLMNVAKYLNGDWKPDWSDEREPKFYLCIGVLDCIEVDDTDDFNNGSVYFKCPNLAEQAIEILGEDTLKLALSTDW